ncbi:MAG: hypothetical protein ACYCPQ_06000 [Elusimicrobiota bacterium]
MKKETGKKVELRARRIRHKAGHANSLPMEFGRSWQDLELQNERLQVDWMSLAAQMGVDDRPHYEAA